MRSSKGHIPTEKLDDLLHSVMEWADHAQIDGEPLQQSAENNPNQSNRSLEGRQGQTMQKRSLFSVTSVMSSQPWFLPSPYYSQAIVFTKRSLKNLSSKSMPLLWCICTVKTSQIYLPFPSLFPMTVQNAAPSSLLIFS